MLLTIVQCTLYSNGNGNSNIIGMQPDIRLIEKPDAGNPVWPNSAIFSSCLFGRISGLFLSPDIRVAEYQM